MWRADGDGNARKTPPASLLPGSSGNRNGAENRRSVEGAESVKTRRTFRERPRSLYSLANQPRSRKPKPPDWMTPAIEAKMRRDPVCRNCGFVGVDPHHAVPRSLSPHAGRSDPRNIIPLCRFCHDRFHGGTPLPRSVFTEAELAFVQTLIGPGWLARRYPRESE